MFGLEQSTEGGYSGPRVIANAGVSLDRQRHMPQLDSLRAFAVFGVMVEHFLPPTDAIRAALPWGDFGVRLFFVLSGFLISGILLRCRDQLDSRELALGAIIRTFFARRFIRLIPVYYAYLAAIAVLLPPARRYLWIFVLYLQNFLFALNPKVFQLMLAHFWTLAVEEQFYITWPAVLLLVPRRRLPMVLTVIVVAGPMLRLVGLAFGLSPHQIRMMMPAHFDTLGLGGLLALLQSGSEGPESGRARMLAAAGFWVGLGLSVVAVVAERLQLRALNVLISESAMGLLCTWIVFRAARGFGGFAGTILDSKALQYVGKISYGIYVYHFNVPGLIRDKLAVRFGVALPSSPWQRFSILVAFTLAVASLSWHWFERPLNRLKNRFPYRR